MYLIDSRRIKTGEEGWPTYFSMNYWPFKAAEDESLGSGDFRHGGIMNSLYVDSHVGKNKVLNVLGTGTDFTYDKTN